MANEPLTQQPVPPLPLLEREPVDWEPPLPPTDLIFDDGEPLESPRHRIAINALIDVTLQALQPQTRFFVGGNMFVYYSSSQVLNRDFKGPDFFVVLDVEAERERKGWVSWEEAGRYPDVIVELLSPSTAQVDRTTKKDLYEKTFHAQDYFIYDPFDPGSLQGWHLNAQQRYEPIAPNSQGWLWCETLGLWFGLWEGSIQREPSTGSCAWLRLYDAAGNLIPLSEELAKQEFQRAEQEHQRAEQEHQRAEQESQRAEQERQRAEQERQRAEQERQRAEQLAARLRALGEDPENL